LVVVFLIEMNCGSDLSTRNLFAQWKLQYNKTYASQAEEEVRFGYFQMTLHRVKRLNSHKGATFGVNLFSDLSPEEFRAKYLMPRRNPSPKPLVVNKVQKRLAAPPQVFDWRTKAMVTPVKNQEQCGSCWAFSATETIESAYMMKHGLNNVTMPPLSPQQIVDCDFMDGGCGGGNPPTAYQYIISAGGQETNAVYPYQGQNGQCVFQSSKIYAKIAAWQYACDSYEEATLLQNTYTYGPSSICVDAANWQDYQSGIMTAWQCAWIDQLDHCVQAVGWNLGASTQYWSVRNSWSTQWGEQGYIRLEYGANTCGLTQEATYVTA